MKAQALADHLGENLVDDKYQPLSTYFPDEEVNSVEVISEDTNAWKMFFDGAMNAKGVGIGTILISPTSQHYPTTARLQFFCSNNTTEYEAYIMGMNMEIDQDVEELQHVEDLSKRFKSVEFRHGYYKAVEIEPDVQAWYHDIKRFLKTKEYPGQAGGDQKRTIKRLAIGFFLSGEVLYKRTPDLNLLRCVDAQEAGRIMNEVHTYEWVCPVKENPLRRILLDDYGKGLLQFCPELSSMSSARCPDSCTTFRTASYVEAITFKAITKKAVVMSCTPTSSAILPKANCIVEAANKNIKKILRKMIQSSRQWHKKLPFALLGYRTTVCTSVGATPYLLVYGTEVVITVEVVIPSFRIIVEAEVEDSEWVKTRLE
ncbi:uncharacterized protein [Nicotiana sylvestris]|uniref:uncharacterized protein n=1 Tax=Nicotiana sylvestris TaxID=4096 RepID=UPI00388CDC5B